MKYEIQLLSEGALFDTYILYQFISRLVQPFDETDAYKLGLIDKDGKVLKKRSQLKTQREKDAFTVFDLLIFNIKKILSLVPLGKTVLGSYAAALYLIKEGHKDWIRDPDMLYEDFADFMEDLEEDPESVTEIQKLIVFMTEDAAITVPANNIGSGKIAGTGADGQDPVVPKKKKPNILTRPSITPPPVDKM